MKTTTFEQHDVLPNDNVDCKGSQYLKNESEDLSTYHNKEYLLQNVKHDWYEKANDEVVLVMYVRDIIAKNLQVAFEENRLHVHFKTGDEKFHKQHETSTDTIFHWPLNLSNTIIADACTYNIKVASLEIKLKKKNNGKWTTITKPNLPGGARIAAKEVEKPWNLSSGPNRPSEQKQETLIPSAATFSPSSSSSYSSTTSSSHNNRQQVRNLKLGYTGLDNLGNTCFMNSVLQALANTRELRDYFLGPLYKVDINCENPLGAGGRLAHAFHLLLKNLWSGETTTFAPAKLKNIVASRCSQFTGFMQHDAQEFMAFLLDGLHEDVNRIKNKPYFEFCDIYGKQSLVHNYYLSYSLHAHFIKEYPGQADCVVAQEAWRLHKSRNDSFIVDKFHGQYKSKLICPECGKESITFDPFLFLPVPLPKPTKMLSLIFLPMQPSRRLVEMKVHVSKESGDVLEVLTLVAQKMSLRPDNLVMFESLKSEIYRIFSLTTTTHHMSLNDFLIVCEVQSKKSSEPVFQIPVLQQLAVPNVAGGCANCHRSAETAGVKIRRCTQCKRVGYCNQDCQKAHWQEHKKECKKISEAIGTPFIISIADSKATYNNLWKLILDYARLSVDITYKTNYSESRLTENRQKIQKFDDNGNPIDCSEKSLDDFVPFDIFSSETCRNTNEIPLKMANTGDKPVYLGNVKQITIRWKNNCTDEHYVAVKSISIKCPVSVNVGTQNTGEVSELQECIQLFTEPEILAAQEAWYCPQCKTHREATKQLSLWQLPDILIIQLKRFSFKDTIWRHKIDRRIEFPVRGLDMQPFCVNKDPRASPAIYDLFAVINHHGGIFGGHYTSYVRLPEVEESRKSTIGWRLCDDNRVTEVHSEDQVITKAAYVMFYHRRKSYRHEVGIPRANMNSEDDGVCEEEDIESSFGKESKGDDEYFSAAEALDDVRYSSEEVPLANMGATGGKLPVDTFFPTSSVFPDHVINYPLPKEGMEDSDSSNESQDKSPPGDLKSIGPSARCIVGSSLAQIKNAYDTGSEFDDKSPSPIGSDLLQNFVNRENKKVKVTFDSKDSTQNFVSSVAENICNDSNDLGYTDMDSID